MKTIRVMLLMTFILALWSATQWFAYVFNYQPQLGQHINHVYPPWKIIQWWRAWEHIYPKQLENAGYVGTGIGSVLMIITLFYSSYAGNRIKGDNRLHGSARWANADDIDNMSLYGNSDGVVVGGMVDEKGAFQYLRHNGPEHILTCAPTRSGKGVGLIIPTLLSWPYSSVITDMKGELYALTAGWRKKFGGNKVLKFEPAAVENDVFWNPLNEIRLDEGREVGDVQNLVSIIVNPDGKAELDHWEKTAQALLVGVILHALYKARKTGIEASLPQVDRMLSPAGTSVKSLWLDMTSYKHSDGQNHHAVSSAARDMLDRPDEEAGSVLSTAKSFLALYRDPIVAKAVSSSSFHIKDLMNHETPVSLYIVTTPNDKTRMRPLVRVLVNSIIRVLADRLEFEKVDGHTKQKKPHKHRLLCMFDEFPSLGRIGIIEDALAHVAGYGIKFYLICQDIRQLRNSKFGYGPEETITSNCHVQNAFPPNNLETAEHLSKLTGETTVVKEQITTSGRRGAFADSNVSRHYHEVKRNLLTADECLRLPGARKDGELITEAGDMLISVSGFPVIYGKQPLYFKDANYLKRAAVDAPKESDRLRNVIQNKVKIDAA